MFMDDGSGFTKMKCSNSELSNVDTDPAFRRIWSWSLLWKKFGFQFQSVSGFQKKKIPILVINMKICWNRSQVKKILNRSFKKELVNHMACPVPLQNKNSFLSSQIYTRENTFHTHDATHGKSTKNNSTRRKWKGNERAEWNAVEYETCSHTQPTQMSAPQQKTPEYENEITKN